MASDEELYGSGAAVHRRLADVEAERLAPVCADCGREQHRTPGVDCDQPDWHAWPEPPEAEPALKGADLVQHLQRERTSLQDQVVYASRLLAALCMREEDGRLTVTMQELEAVDGTLVRTWHDLASDAMVYEVQR